MNKKTKDTLQWLVIIIILSPFFILGCIYMGIIRVIDFFKDIGKINNENE